MMKMEGGKCSEIQVNGTIIKSTCVVDDYQEFFL